MGEAQGGTTHVISFKRGTFFSFLSLIFNGNHSCFTSVARCLRGETPTLIFTHQYMYTALVGHIYMYMRISHIPNFFTSKNAMYLCTKTKARSFTWTCTTVLSPVFDLICWLLSIMTPKQCLPNYLQFWYTSALFNTR